MNKYELTFCRKLNEWLEKKYRGTSRQFIAELNDYIKNNISKDKKLLVTDKQLSNVINERRRGSERWRRIVSEYIGVPYEEMMGFDKQESQNSNIVEIEHVDIVKRFRNKNLAKAINEKLLALELMNPEELKEVEDFIRFRIGKYDQRKSDQPEKIPKTGDRRKKVG